MLPRTSLHSSYALHWGVPLGESKPLQGPFSCGKLVVLVGALQARQAAILKQQRPNLEVELPVLLWLWLCTWGTLLLVAIVL